MFDENKINFVVAGLFLAALGTSLGQSTVHFSASLTTTVAENAGCITIRVLRRDCGDFPASVD